MNPTQCAAVLVRALMKGDEDLIHSTVRYAKHITQKSVEGNWETEFEVFQHSLECSLCFTFNLSTSTSFEPHVDMDFSQIERRTRTMSNNEVKNSVDIVTKVLHALERTDPDTLMDILAELDEDLGNYTEAIKIIKKKVK